MEFKVEQLVDSFTKRYIEDIAYKTKEQWYAIFDIINEEYKKTNECPICSDQKGSSEGRYYYGDTKIGCQNEIFCIFDDVISFVIKANYCPICGKKIS